MTLADIMGALASVKQAGGDTLQQVMSGQPRSAPLAGVLPYVFGRADALKRQLVDLATNPKDVVAQRQGQLEDATRNVASGGVLAAAGSPEYQRWSNALDAMGPGFLGATTYHGTPHEFAAFDASKIGTGEGAQSYGYGHYVAENPKVAKSYSLSNNKPDVSLSTGERFAYGTPQMKTLFNFSSPPRTVGDIRAQIAELNKQWPGRYDHDLAVLSGLADDAKVAVGGGNLYRVDLSDASMPKMLDWDRPIGAQPHVASVLNQISLSAPLEGTMVKASTRPWMTGQQLYQTMAHTYDSPEAASSLLRDLGIPGIRYLDQASRDVGKGTSNYVVFPGNEHLLDILGKE